MDMLKRHFGRKTIAIFLTFAAFSLMVLSGFINSPCAASSVGSDIPNVHIGLTQYSPAMQMVPGYPFTVSIKNPAGTGITVTVNAGTLETWNRKNGKVHDVGKSVKIQSGDTIYWSPLSGGKTATGKTILTAVAVKNGKRTGRTQIEITQDKNDRYVAKHTV